MAKKYVFYNVRPHVCAECLIDSVLDYAVSGLEKGYFKKLTYKWIDNFVGCVNSSLELEKARWENKFSDTLDVKTLVVSISLQELKDKLESEFNYE